TMRRVVFAPALWPAARGSPLFEAQRPLPSMMMARCAGAGPAACQLSKLTLNGHDFPLFFREQAINPLDVFVGQCLNARLGPALLVFTDLLFVDQFLAVLIRIAADIAYRNAAIFGFLTHDLDQITAPIFGQRRQNNADHLARSRRVEP